VRTDFTFLMLVAMVATAAGIAFLKGGLPLILKGFKRAGRIFQTVWLRLLFGIALGGLIQVLIPHELIAAWIGPASGFKGLLIGSYIGLFSIGGPHVRMPIIAAVYAAGAGAGPIIALLIAMNLISLQMLITWQIPFFGVRMPLARYLVCLFVPPLAGLAGAAVYRLLNIA